MLSATSLHNPNAWTGTDAVTFHVVDANIGQALTETLTKLDAEIALVEAKAEKLKLERQGVEVALRRFGGGRPTPRRVEPGAPVRKRSSNQQNVTDTGVSGDVLDVLRRAEQPVDLASVREATRWSNDQVRSAMGYLNRKGLVENVGRGLWQAAHQNPNTDATPADTGATSMNNSHREGGGASGTDQDRVRGVDSLWQAELRDNGHGAPVMGAPR